MNDTIVAISTALGVGAISIVRISGEDAIKIARECLSNIIRERIIFIVTDGFPDDSNSATNEAKSATKLGIDIMTLGTDDADLNFLNSIATKKGFARKVDSKDFQQGIKDMARLLPS